MDRDTVTTHCGDIEEKGICAFAPIFGRHCGIVVRAKGRSGDDPILSRFRG